MSAKRAIWKYKIRRPGSQPVFLPVGATPVYFGMQALMPTLWCEVDIDDRTEREYRTFEIIGTGRCGVEPDNVFKMAKTVNESQGLRFMGLMGYDGHCTRGVDALARETCSRKANQILVETKEHLEKSGLKIEIVSGSGTYTYKYATQFRGITEIQAGTYLLMDTTFRESGVTEFELTLTVLATIISKPIRKGAGNLAIIDLGRKAMHPYYGLPEVKQPKGAKVIGMSQEHGKVELEGTADDLKVGDKMELWVRDANDTINLYDKFYAIRDNVVEAVWDIPARGFVT